MSVEDKTLPSQDIERICKALIRLLKAPLAKKEERTSHKDKSSNLPDDVHYISASQQKSGNLHESISNT